VDLLLAGDDPDAGKAGKRPTVPDRGRRRPEVRQASRDAHTTKTERPQGEPLSGGRRVPLLRVPVPRPL